MKFIVDTMLGSLTKWLRFLGYDTKYTKDLTDDELIKYAMQDDRILLTRDKVLARTKQIKVIYMNSDNLEDQLKQLIKELKLQMNEDKLLTRCALCNTILILVDKESVRNKVPKGVFIRNDLYWKCEACNKYYWKGTHHDKILKSINKLKIINF